MVKMDIENRGGNKPLYNANMPSFLTIERPTLKMEDLLVLPVCILVFTKSKGKPTIVPITPELKPALKATKTLSLADSYEFMQTHQLFDKVTSPINNTVALYVHSASSRR